jgi:hypothetical protein
MGSMPKAACAVVLALLAMPAGAQAADTSTVVSGTVGSELSIAAATPAAMTLTHATPGLTTSLVTVTSTQPSWTLQVSDQDATTPGYMDRVTGGGPASLSSPLQWKLDGAGTYNDLSSTPATVATGSLVGTALVDFQQALGASDAVSATDTYGLTVTYTVT